MIRALFGLALCLVAGAGPAAAVMDAVTREAVSLSVVEVRARECDGGDRSGSGFVFGAADRLVTALHVVAGCRRLSVFFEKRGGRVVSATLDRALADADLALLALSETAGPALPPAARSAAVDEEVEALGFYLGVPSMDNKRLRVTFGNDRLASMLPDGLRRELAAASAIDPDLRILRLDGHLLPGLSGAPILNAAGQVVAVGSGGLKNGAASVSFAVPVEQIDRLMRSGERSAEAGGRVAGLFAAALPAQAGGAGPVTITCGGLDFIETGRRSFGELAPTADDLIGLAQLVAVAGMDEAALGALSYRIFSPVAGGAAVAVPDWMEVRSAGGHCVATDGLGAIRVEFGGTEARNPAMVQIVSEQFENGFIARSGRDWAPDPQFSYAGPQYRHDGLTVNRKTAIGFDPYGARPNALGFETLMHRGSVFTGAVAVSEWWAPELAANCVFAPFDPTCQEIAAFLPLVVQTVLGVHLTTFPII